MKAEQIFCRNFYRVNNPNFDFCRGKEFLNKFYFYIWSRRPEPKNLAQIKKTRTWSRPKQAPQHCSRRKINLKFTRRCTDLLVCVLTTVAPGATLPSAVGEAGEGGVSGHRITPRSMICRGAFTVTTCHTAKRDKNTKNLPEYFYDGSCEKKRECGSE